MLSNAVRDALRAELDSLKVHRSRLDSKISAIEAILMPDEESQANLFPPRIIAATGTAKATAKVNGVGATVKPTLRDVLRRAVATYSGGMTVDEIVKEVENAKIETKGTTPMRVLVTSDLWRLTKNGQVKKVGKKYYPVPINLTAGMSQSTG